MSKKEHKDGIAYVSTFDILKNKFGKKRKIEKIDLPNSNEAVIPEGIDVNHIAIVLDGEVKDIIRAQNKLAALFLSEPKFVEFNPRHLQVDIGWKYDGENFIKDENE